MGIAYNTNIVRNELAMHLDAANVKSYPASGTVWNDLSGNSNNTTLWENITDSDWNSAGYFTFASDSQMRVPEISAADATIEVWFKQIDFNITRGSYGNGTHFRVYVNTAGSVKWWVREQNSGTSNELTVGNINLNEWVCFVGTYESGVGLQGFLNGELQNSLSTSLIYNNGSNNATVGNTYTTSPNSFAGDIGIVRHYTRTLTASEVKQNFEAQRGRYAI